MRHLVRNLSYQILRKYHKNRYELSHNDMTNVVPLLQRDVVYQTVNALKNGQVVALPTDTIYGLAADLSNSKAVRRIFEIKGRDFNKPVAVCLSRVEDIQKLAVIDILPDGLLKDLLPGPVTVILDPLETVNNFLGIELKVGIRVPGSSFVCDVAREFPFGLALTSANESDQPSCLDPQEFAVLWKSLGLIVDGGKIGSGNSRQGSTIIDLSRGKFVYKIVRKGSALFSTTSILHKYGLTEEEEEEVNNVKKEKT